MYASVQTLLNTAKTAPRGWEPHDLLKACCHEIEAAFEQKPSRLSLVAVVDQLFAGLDRNNLEVSQCYGAAQTIAAAIDRGEDGTHGLPFHNPAHFAKVMVSTVLLATRHNSECAEPESVLALYTPAVIRRLGRVLTGKGREAHPRLDDPDIAALILAATGHDAWHDGGTNRVKTAAGDEIHIPFRLEKRSVDFCLGLLPAHLARASAVRDALTLVYATDISGQAPTPARIVRQAYHARFGGAEPGDAPLGAVASHIRERLGSVLRHPKRTLKAALMGDADVLISTFDMKQHDREDRAIAREWNVAATPERARYFLRDMLDKRLTTPMARLWTKPVIDNLLNIYQNRLPVPQAESPPKP